MKEMKRFLSLLLCLVMLVGLIPSGILKVEAAEGTTYVLAGSDFQADNHTASAANVSSILSQIQKVYGTMDGFLFAGDYDVNYTDSVGGKAKLQATVQGVYGTCMDEVYIQGNHDGDDLVGSTLNESGANDAEDYGVFVINEKDYMWYNNDESTIKNTAANLESYLNEKLNDEYSKPIFVVSHLPLHYSMRTRSGGGDGKYANYIFDVLNKAGENGLNIIFLAGHDHSHGWDDYLGGAAIFLKKGDKINIAQSSTTEFKEETLNFTYMNAGYVGYYGTSYTSDVDKTLTMTTFAITDTEVTITRFDANGTHNLKSAGYYNVEYPDSKYYSTNTDVVESSYTLKLNQFEPDPVVEDVTTGVSVSAPGVTGVTVEVKDVEVPEGYTAYVTYDIDLTGYNQGDTATVTIETPDGFDRSKAAVVLDEGVQIARDTDLSDGITFTTNHFSEYDVAQVDEAAGVTARGYLATDATVSTTALTGETVPTGYYLLRPVRDGNGTLTNVSTKVNDSTGLDVVDTGLNVQDNNLWYYDGTHILNVSDTVKYLSAGPDKDAAKLTDDASATNLVNSVYENTNYRGTYTLAATGNTTNYKYLNRAGSGSFAGAYNNDGNGDEGSRWRFYQVTFSNADPVTLTVTPASKTVTTGKTATLHADVQVADADAASYTIAWTSSDPTVATVDANGVVTGVDDGNVTITATLTKANGQNVNGTVDVKIPVTVKTRTAESITVEPMYGTVQRGTKSSAKTGSTMTVTYNNGDVEYNVPVTVSMLTNADGSAVSTRTLGNYENLTVTYEGASVTGYTLHVVAKTGNDHPEYPNEGAVKVTKHATGIDFQASGVAQVEVAVSGVPVQKGADVVVVIDTSSSMDKDVDGQDPSNGEKSRIDILSESLEKMVNIFQTPDDAGNKPDIDIAVIDFNGYGDRITGATLNGGYRDETNQAAVYTGTTDGNWKLISAVGLSASNFVDVETLNAATFAAMFNEDRTSGGTNYDSGLENAYKLLQYKQEANGEEERDQYVIFLSDGAPNRYNGYENSANSGYDNWDNWLKGYWVNQDALVNAIASNANQNAYPYFYNGNGTNHPHRMAEAIKGDPNEDYDVVIRSAANANPKYIEQRAGLGAQIYSIGFGLADDGSNSYGYIRESTMENLLKTISSGEGYYQFVKSADALDNAFGQIASEINYAASNARLVDQMGEEYDLQMATHEYNPMGSNERIETITPTIEVLTYDIYTRADWEDEECEFTQIGDRKTNADGSYIHNVLETVTFSDDGTKAYSDHDSVGPDGTTIPAGSNILIDGIIYANTFWYNTTANAVKIEGVDIPTKSTGGLTTKPTTNELPGETFYWKVGTVMTKELAIRYYVYLEGSLKGEREAGSYNTNEYATLYYDNYLENPCYKDAPVPVLAWEAARVSYAFYLVNEKGVPVNNDGVEVSFANKVKVVDRTPYGEILLNSEDTLNSMTIIAGDKKVLPDGYVLYDEAAQYTVMVNSNATGGWEITKGDDKAATTYVTEFSDTVQYSNELSVENTDYDYTHTVVWFAIQWEPKPMPDTVVIDYGLPVDIHVMTNDMFGKYGTLTGVAAGDQTVEGKVVTNTITDKTAHGSFGTAEITSGVIRYTLDNSSNLVMNHADVFTYSVVYENDNEVYSSNNGTYYETVTVIPATTIYYEDTYLTLESYTVNGIESTKDEPSAWTQNGATDAAQAEDRPGSVNYGFGTVIDANNVYGYDVAYANMSTYSMDNAAMLHVDAARRGEATFTFYGTGFDVISMTSNTTGTLIVQVYSGPSATGSAIKNLIVDTYYGMKEDGTLELNDPEALYQVPVMKVAGLAYGPYTVKITAGYSSQMDHTNDDEDGYDLYLDAIRIYDPAGTTYGDGDGAIDQVIQNAYIADGEGWPAYEELRNNVIKASDYKVTENEDGTVTVTGDNLPGAIFIDCNNEVTSIADYVSYGPNNELYLAKDQAIAFNVVTDNKTVDGTELTVADVQLGIKVGNGGSVTYKIYNPDSEGNEINSVVKTVSSATDMYYSILSYAKAGTVVIQNVSGGILSLTNIKVTYTPAPETDETTTTPETPADPESTPSATSLMWMDGPSAGYALMSLRAPVVEEEIPEVTEPEVTEPEETVPEETEPEVTEPEVTEPEETEPEDPTEDPGTNNNSVIDRLKEVFDWLIGLLRP